MKIRLKSLILAQISPPLGPVAPKGVAQNSKIWLNSQKKVPSMRHSRLIAFKQELGILFGAKFAKTSYFGAFSIEMYRKKGKIT